MERFFAFDREIRPGKETSSPWRLYESEILVGRDKELREIIAKLEVDKFALVAGPGRIGKTSLCKAAIRQGGYQQIRLNMDWGELDHFIEDLEEALGKHPPKPLVFIDEATVKDETARAKLAYLGEHVFGKIPLLLNLQWNIESPIFRPDKKFVEQYFGELAPVTVGSIDNDAARKVLRIKGQTFSDGLENQIIEMAGGNPALLQMIADQFYIGIRDGQTPETILYSIELNFMVLSVNLRVMKQEGFSADNFHPEDIKGLNGQYLRALLPDRRAELFWDWAKKR